MAFLKTNLSGHTIVLNSVDLLKEENLVEETENEFHRFIKGTKNKIGFHLSGEIKEYILHVTRILDDIEKIIKVEQNQDLLKLFDLRNTIILELKSQGLFDEKFLKRQREILETIEDDLRKALKSETRYNHRGIISLLGRIANVKRIERLVENRIELEAKANKRELKLREYITSLLLHLPEHNRKHVEDEIISLLIVLEHIISYSSQIEIQISKVAAKKLFLLDYYIKVFSKIAEGYGIQEELEQLIALRQKFNVLLHKDLKIGKSLMDFTSQVKENHQALVERIQNSRLIFNRKEPLRTAVKRSFILANKLKDTLGLDERFNIDRSLFISYYRQVYQEVSGYSEADLDNSFKDKKRLARFNIATWSVGTLNVKDLGVWPKFSHIDAFTTCGNLLDTGRKINDILHNTHKFVWPETSPPNLPMEKIKKFISIRKHADIIYRLLPIIVTAKGPRTRRVNADRHYREKLGFGFKITPFDIDDGNNRAMSFSTFGIRKINCFVGSGLITDSPSIE